MTKEQARNMTKKTTTKKPSARKQPLLKERIKATSANIANKKRKQRTEFDWAVFEKIIEALETRDPKTGLFPSLLQVLSQPNMPSRSSFYRWLDEDKTGEMRKEYDTVMKACYDNMHDERFLIADNIADDVKVNIDEEGAVKADWNEINILRAKEKIRVREWTLSRLAPNKYGENLKLEVEVDASPEALEALASIGESNRQRSLEAAKAHAQRLANRQKEITEQ